MTVLQWALLLVGAAAVIAIWWSSRRAGRLPDKWAPGPGAAAPRAAPRLPGAEQMDIFRATPGAGSNAEFDEFGVGKPRKRVPPSVGASGTGSLFPAGEAPAATPAGAPAPPAEERIVTLLIAEREGTAIFGPKIHQALKGQKLQYGDRRIYHRLKGGATVFSVASLVKPGTLDPAESTAFSTPGLSVFALLPGPQDAVATVQDMIDAARALAASLNAEVFDAHRQPLTADSARALIDDVRAWSLRQA